MLIDKDTHPSKRYTHTHTHAKRESESARERGTAVVLALHLSVCRNMARTAENTLQGIKVSDRYTAAQRILLSAALSLSLSLGLCFCSLWLSGSALALSALRSKRQTALPFYNKIDANCKQTFSRQFNSQHATRKNKRKLKKILK